MTLYKVRGSVTFETVMTLDADDKDDARKAWAERVAHQMKQISALDHSTHITSNVMQHETRPLWVIKRPDGFVLVCLDANIYQKELDNTYVGNWRIKMSRVWNVPVNLTPANVIGIVESTNIWDLPIDEANDYLRTRADQKEARNDK